MRVGEEILLVEDNPDDVLLIKRALRKNGLGCEVVVARDGEEALRHLLYPGEREAPRPMPGLMLVDIHLPKVDGLEVLRRVRADGRTRDLAVVLLVSPGAERRGAAADRGGTLADLCIQKAVDFEWIVWEVGRLKALLPDARFAPGEVKTRALNDAWNAEA